MNEEQSTERTHYPDLIEYKYEFDIPKGQAPERIDKFLARSIHNASRTKVQAAMDAGAVLVNGISRKVSYKLSPLDHIICTIMKLPPIELVPENIPLNIVYEDNELLVVNKPANMCCHPGVGNRYGTLLNALLYHFGIRESIDVNIDEDEENINYELPQMRPGMVHRIDKDTTGLLVIAKNVDVHSKLALQFANKTTQRTYYGIVWGRPKQDEGRIVGNIARSQRDRTSFAVVEDGGKHAITDYKVIERYAYAALLQFNLHTGRTHQIRVHSAHIGHKLVGDVRYGGNICLFGKENPEWKKFVKTHIEPINRQMLHAKTLGFQHPITKEQLLFDSQLPDDMQGLIKALQEYK